MPIHVLVVDDSALMRKMISDILASSHEITVVDTARNGKDAVAKTQALHPDVITMDVEMPVMDGIEAVRQIMATTPTPILMLSALTTHGADVTLEALHAGAVDFLCKPSGSISMDLKVIGEELIAKVTAAASAHVHPCKEPTPLAKRTRVLVVDDSPFVQKAVRDILSHEPDMVIVGEASTGREAIEHVDCDVPDLILMDIEMPVMNGVDATHEILKKHQIPIIIFSGQSAQQMDQIKTALELGAVDYLPKPAVQAALRSAGPLLAKKIREAMSGMRHAETSHRTLGSEKIVVIGTSTGGPQTLAQLIPQFPDGLPAGILIVQHMPQIFTKSLAERLDKLSTLRVREAQDGDEIVESVALVAPGDYHMAIQERSVDGKRKRYIALNQDEKLHGVRPSVDVTFTAAANTYGANTIGVLLTGMGRDGASAMGLIKARGGHTIAQDEATSIIFGMPKEAIKLGVVDEVLPLGHIASRVTTLVTSTVEKVVR